MLDRVAPMEHRKIDMLSMRSGFMSSTWWSYVPTVEQCSKVTWIKYNKCCLLGGSTWEACYVEQLHWMIPRNPPRIARRGKVHGLPQAVQVPRKGD